MKVGDYVRINNGGIGKIINCPFKSMYLDEIWGYIENTETIITDNVYKTSPNIIDLIEVGDYVNGERVINIIKKHKYLEVSDEEIVIDEKDIKSIVTKEQFEAIKYEIK